MAERSGDTAFERLPTSEQPQSSSEAPHSSFTNTSAFRKRRRHSVLPPQSKFSAPQGCFKISSGLVPHGHFTSHWAKLHRLALLAWLTTWAACPSLHAQAAQIGASAPPVIQVSASGYMELWPGDLPIVISAPHGGDAKPAEYPDRTWGKTVRDDYTLELAFAIRQAMEKRFGAAPYLVICRLSRWKVDCNREITEGAQGHPLAEKAWHEYHAWIDRAEAAVLGKSPRGLYLDIHGHGHPKQRVELGYTIPYEDLVLSDAELNEPSHARHSSIRALSKAPTAPLFAELLRGPTSFGGLLQAHGMMAVPAPHEKLAKGDLYFAGGYDVQVHGSRQGGSFDGIQLEFPQIWRDTQEHREKAAEILCNAIEKYLKLNAKFRVAPLSK